MAKLGSKGKGSSHDETSKADKSSPLGAVGAIAGIIAFVAVLADNLSKIQKFYEEHFLSQEELLKRRFHTEADAVVHGRWTHECAFRVPDGWIFTWDSANNMGAISPGPGTALNQAQFTLDIAESQGAVGEASFFQKEMRKGAYNRGYLLTHSDYLEAYRTFDPDIKAEEKDMSKIGERTISFLVVFEDGRSISSELGEIWKHSPAGMPSTYLLDAMLRPTNVANQDEERFNGYRQYSCSALGVVDTEDFANLCASVIEATTRFYTWKGYGTECRQSDDAESEGESGASADTTNEPENSVNTQEVSGNTQE